MKRVASLAFFLVLGSCKSERPEPHAIQFVLPRAGELDPEALPIETRVRVELYYLNGATITGATAAGASDCAAALEADGSITLLATTPGETHLDVTLHMPDGSSSRRTNVYTFASLASLRVRRSLQRSAASEADVLLVGQAFEWCTNGYTDAGRLVEGLAIETELSPRLVLERAQLLNDTSDGSCALYRATAPTAGVVVFRAGKVRRVAPVTVVDASRVTKLELVSLASFGEARVETTGPSTLDTLAAKTTFELDLACVAPIGARFTIDDGRMGLLSRSQFTTPTVGLLERAANQDVPYIPVQQAGTITATVGTLTVSGEITAGSCP